MKNRIRLAAVLCCVLMLTCLLPTISSAIPAGPSLRTTLTDNALQRGSRKTFDVWARNAGGEKIVATVRHNGQKVEPTWDDNEKTSYTLNFTEEGENVVTVTAFSDGGRKAELTYHILYSPTEPGGEIGRAIWSVELFTIGGGYLIEPTELPIIEGETAAEQLLRLISENGLVAYYDGKVQSSFYLAYIADGTSERENYNGYKRSDSPTNPQELDLTPEIPPLLVPYLEKNMSYFDPEDYTKNSRGYLGEFAFTNGSGWIYEVNHVFPNVGFADCYLSDGDVVRVQFTLGYGADIGGAEAVGNESGGYYPVANKDRLTKRICEAHTLGLSATTNVGRAYRAALSVMETLDAAQDAVDAADAALALALKDPVEELPTEEITTEKTTEPIPSGSVPAQTEERTLSQGGCFAGVTEVWFVFAAVALPGTFLQFCMGKRRKTR